MNRSLVMHAQWLARMSKPEQKAYRESCAGPRPPDREGYTLYAKLNHNRFGSHFVWNYRKLQ